MNPELCAGHITAKQGELLLDAYSQAHKQYYEHKMRLAEARMKLAFHDQRQAGFIMLNNRTDVIGMGPRVSWGYTQRRAYQIIEQCRQIIAECKKHTRSGAPSYTFSDN